MLDQGTENTLVCKLTANVPAGIATLGLRGPRAFEITTSLIQLRNPRLKIGVVTLGRWPMSEIGSHVPGATTDRSSTETGFEQVLVCRTDDSEVELSCHGGNAICRAIIASLVKRGATEVSAEDWPSELDCPLARQAQRDLVFATTDKAAAVLLDQMNGALSEALKDVIEGLRSEPSAQPDAIERLDSLLERASFGLRLLTGHRVVLAGPPNVGKSSLINALLGRTQAIVHHEAGTTRDWTESATAIRGWPVMLIDTAGLRETSDEIERQGVELADQQTRKADLLVIVVDAKSGWQAEHQPLYEASVDRMLIVVSKADLGGSKISLPVHSDVRTSVSEGTGIEELLQAIADKLFTHEYEAFAPIPFRISHVEALRRARDLLQGRDSESARAVLERLLNTGESTK